MVTQRLATQWATYVEQVVPAAAGDTQVRETKQAFYAGAISILHILDSIDPNTSQEEGVKLLAGLHEECARFIADHIKKKMK
jgi:hypothetical protein